MPELDQYRSVLGPGVRTAWPVLAAAVDGIDGYLVGGTALAAHLRHRTSYDLDYMAHQTFSGERLLEAVESTAGNAVVVPVRAEPDRLHATIDGASVQVFTAPTRGEHPGHVRRLAHPKVIAGMPVASLADLLAMKLDLVMYRPKLRDYMDLAAIDHSGDLRLEDGFQLHMRRYGTQPQSEFLDRIVDRLESPGDLAADAHFAGHADRVLGYLSGRIPDLRAHLQRLRRAARDSGPPPSRKLPAGAVVAAPTLPAGGSPASASQAASGPKLRPRIVTSLERKPRASYAEIARDCGASAGYVAQIAREEGLARRAR